MKAILLIAACVITLQFCKLEGNQKNTATIAVAVTDTIDYTTQIQPLLQKRCSPCHFSGGKMYERMPFDKGETIVNHEGGVLKRIKDQNELSLIKQFIQQSKAPGKL